MDQVQELLESGRRISEWGDLLGAFAAVEEAERRRFSWVAPQEADLKWLKEWLAKEEVDRLIGVGCGSGFLERLVAQFSGTSVTGVELKGGWWMSKYCPRPFVPMMFASSPVEKGFFDRPEFSGRRKSLFFCYFNDCEAFKEYLRSFKGLHLILVGPKDNVGVHADPMPLNPDFGQPGWEFEQCRYLGDGVNVLCLYKRVNKGEQVVV